MTIIDITDFGAVGNGVFTGTVVAGTDDSAAIQAAIDTAVEGDVVLFPEGTYICKDIIPVPGVVYRGYNTTLLRPYTGGKWTKFFNYLVSSPTEPVPVATFEGFHFNATRSIQGDYEAYELEQAHCIAVTTTAPYYKHRVRAIVRDCTFEECTGDAVACQYNAHVVMENCIGTNIFRGLATVTGKHNWLHMSSCTGDLVDYENESVFDGSIITIEDSTLNRLHLGGSDRNCVRLTNTQVDTYTLVNNARGVVYAENCTFGKKAPFTTGLKIQYPGAVHFDNCVIEDVTILWVGQYYQVKGGRVRFDNCDFMTADTLDYAIESGRMYAAYKTTLILDSCTFTGAYSYISYIDGGNVSLFNLDTGVPNMNYNGGVETIYLTELQSDVYTESTLTTTGVHNGY